MPSNAADEPRANSTKRANSIRLLGFRSVINAAFQRFPVPKTHLPNRFAGI